jgi:hypothetical protein
MNDFLVLSVIVLWLIYGYFVVSRSERLIEEIRIWKNLDHTRGIWWGVFSLFILIDYRRKYLSKDDLSFLPEYKRIVFHHCVLFALFILFVIFEQLTSY